LVHEYVGGYDDWLRQRPTTPLPEPKQKPVDKPKREKPVAKRKLSFKEQRELEALPEQIEKMEAEHQDLLLRLSSPTFYREDPAAIAQVKARYEGIERELPLLYARWQELEEIKGA
jgi:ATP-binding cassette subfamily F protein uup